MPPAALGDLAHGGDVGLDVAVELRLVSSGKALTSKPS